MYGVALRKESNSEIRTALNCFHVNVVDVPPICDEDDIRPGVVFSWYSLVFEFSNW
jgi:hypothetical protein